MRVVKYFHHIKSMLGFDICNLLDKLIGKKVKVHQMSIEFLAILFRPFKAQIFIQYNKIRKQYLFFQILWFLTVYELQFKQKKNICHLNLGTIFKATNFNKQSELRFSNSYIFKRPKSEYVVSKCYKACHEMMSARYKFEAFMTNPYCNKCYYLFF